MVSSVGSKVDGVATSPIERFIDCEIGLKVYEIILNDLTCYYRDHDHPNLKGIKVTGLEKDMSGANMKKIVQAANVLFYRIRNLAHGYQKFDDDHLYSRRLKEYQTALAAYEAACKETGLTAESEPSLDSLKKYVQPKHRNE
jgi:hypothetical protein